MFIDSYQVEVQNLVTKKWKVDRCFYPHYKWRRVVYRILGLLKRVQQEIIGDPQVQALIVKCDAHRYARHVMRVSYPRLVRITCTKQEGVRFVKIIIWQDGRWLKNETT